jgi:hypothetical protein
VSSFPPEIMVGANVGCPKIGWSPRTQESRTQVTRTTKGRQRISKSRYSPQKLWTPLHVPSHPLL